jgi:hypothetical protein
VMGQSPDFKPFAPRCSRYAMGAQDSVVEAAVTGLEELLGEMERRGMGLERQPGSPPGPPASWLISRVWGCIRWCASSMSAMRCTSTLSTESGLRRLRSG